MQVTLIEAADQPGGQVRLTAQTKRRAEMIGIIDWRMAQCAALGVEFRFNTWAEAEDVTALNPDIVIIATGGIAQMRPCRTAFICDQPGRRTRPSASVADNRRSDAIIFIASGDTGFPGAATSRKW